MDKYIDIPLNEESIIDFYDSCAKNLGYNPNTCRYDCTKILVSKERYAHIRRYYESLGCPNYEITYRWATIGPKIAEELHSKEAKIQEGFIREE